MCLDLNLWRSATSEITFGQLANVQTVGIGLYLALVVIQAVSASGIANLRRRATAIQSVVNGSKLVGEAGNMHRLQSDVHRLEIGFQALNRALLIGTSFLFLVAIGYFIYCTIWQSLDARVDGVLFIIGYYLVLPIMIFGFSTWLIGRRCKDVRDDIADAEKRVTKAIMG